MFAKECLLICKSIIYFSFIAVVLLFYITQLGDFAGEDIRHYHTRQAEPENAPSDSPLIAPVPGQEHYGYRNAEIPEQVMPNAIASLVAAYAENEFACYSTGFYRGIKLSEAQLADIRARLTKMTGLSVDELLNRRNEKLIAYAGLQVMSGTGLDYSEVIPIVVAYDAFKEHMQAIDKMIGGSSYYAQPMLSQYGKAAITYEESLAAYLNFMNKDKITGAYARLFCDYMGIAIALFSIFIPVSFLLRDKRASMNELIYSRGKSSASIVLTRYFALVCMTILPILLFSLVPTIQLSLFAAQNNLAVDYFAFGTYIVTWLLPIVLTTTAVAYVLTTLTHTPIAILVMLVWNFFGILTSVHSLTGGSYGMEIVIRHNSLGNLHLVQENMTALIVNRLSYTILSCILVMIAILLYDRKRRGRLHGIRSIKKAICNR